MDVSWLEVRVSAQLLPVSVATYGRDLGDRQPGLKQEAYGVVSQVMESQVDDPTRPAGAGECSRHRRRGPGERCAVRAEAAPR